MQFAAALSIFICCSLASSTITLPSSSDIQETDSNETSQAYKETFEYVLANKLFPFLMHDGKMNKQNSNERAVNATTSETTATTDPASSTTEIRQSIVIEITTRAENEPSSTMNSEASSNANDQSKTAQMTVSEILEDSSSSMGGSTTVGTSQTILEQAIDLSSESASKEVEENHSSDGLNRVTGLESTTNFDDLLSSDTNQELTTVDEVSFSSEQTSKSFNKGTSQTEFSVRTSIDYITPSDRPAISIPTNEHFGTTEGFSNFQSTESATHNHPETDVFTDNGRGIDTTEIDYQTNLQQEQITSEFVSEVATSSDQVQTSFNEKSIRVTSQGTENPTDGEVSSPLTTESGHIFTNELELRNPIPKSTSQQTTLGSTARFHLTEYSTPSSSNQITDRTQASTVPNIDESRATTEVTTTENVESSQERIMQTTVVQLLDGTKSDNSTTVTTDKTVLPNVENTDSPNTDTNQEFSTRSSTSEIISSAITEQLQEETSRNDYSPKTLTPQISTTTFKEFPDSSTTLRTLESNIVTMELLDEVPTESVPKLSTEVPKLPNTSIHSSRPSTTSKIPALPTIRNAETTTSDTHQRHLPKSLTTESSTSTTSKPIGTSTRAHRLHIDPSQESSPLSSTNAHHTSTNLPSTVLADNPPTSTWCPCLGSILSGCLPYDSRLQAMTLEEAMIAFPDLTRSQNIAQPTTIEDEIACTTRECIDCQKDMRKKLAEVGLLPNAIDIAMHAQGNYTNCKKYGFSSGDKKKKDKKKKDSHESSESKEEKEDHKRKNKDEDRKKKQKQKDKSSEKKDKSEERDRKKKKHKRQTLTDGVADPNIIGTRYTMSCTQKGVATDSFGLVPLCSSCWVWRRLPDNYSPQYINELVCDNSDGSCLSGYATCNAGQRIVDAIRNDNGVETRVALTAGTYCECKITSGSAIASLIEGTGLQGPISPLASPIP